MAAMSLQPLAPSYCCTKLPNPLRRGVQHSKNCVNPASFHGLKSSASSIGGSLRQVARQVNRSGRRLQCSASDSPAVAAPRPTWIPVIPLEALPKGERRLVKQNGRSILLLWYRNQIYGIENTSPAEGAYAEGFVNAKLTQDGCIECPSTGSLYDLKTGDVKSWYPNNPVLRFLTKSLRNMYVYPVEVQEGQICVSMRTSSKGAAATEVVIGGAGSGASGNRIGETASDVYVNETKMLVDETEKGFGFSEKNELVNGRAAMAGFTGLLLIELVTGKGILAATGFLSFLYKTVLVGFPLIRY